jgi:hypothetical protein
MPSSPMPKRKRQPEEFDVVEFLRGSDDDLKSALHSLLRDPGVDQAIAGSEIASEVNLIPANKLAQSPEANPDVTLVPHPKLDAIDLMTATKLTGDSIIDAGIKLGPNTGFRERRFAIREMKRYQDAHTRAEQHVYECLWDSGHSHDEVSRAITIGFGAMAKVVGLSESNARINLRSLIAKLAVEEIAQYNCEQSVGRTYRIFCDTEIMRRRREAGLLWFMRRTLAVIFVDPGTGQPLLKRKPLVRQGRVLN